jgi:hypothetical protein
MYLPASLQNIASQGQASGAFPDPKLPQGWKSVGPQWGPAEMAQELGCPAPQEEGEDNEEPAVTVDEVSVEQPMKRQFNESDFQLKFQPREEFGGQRVGFVFRMGAQGLGYYEDNYATAPSAAVPTAEVASPAASETSS